MLSTNFKVITAFEISVTRKHKMKENGFLVRSLVREMGEGAEEGL